MNAEKRRDIIKFWSIIGFSLSIFTIIFIILFLSKEMKKVGPEIDKIKAYKSFCSINKVAEKEEEEIERELEDIEIWHYEDMIYPDEYNIYENTSLSICTDGSGKLHGDKNHLNTTAYFIRDKKGNPVYLNSDKVHYVVGHYNNKEYSLGDFAIVVDLETNKYVYAIVGEYVGTKEKDNNCREVSYSTAIDLGHKYVHGNRGTKEGKYLIFVFPNTSKKWSSMKELENNYIHDIEEYLRKGDFSIETFLERNEYLRW